MFVTFSCCVTIVVPSLVSINTDSFGVIICYNLVTGNTPPCFIPCFIEMKIRASWGYVVNSSRQPVNQFGWNLANLLSDSFSKKQFLWILISFFVFKLQYFFTGSDSDLLYLTSTAYITKDQMHLSKIWDMVFLSNVLRSECDLNWLFPFTFGWPGLKFTVTSTSTQRLSFLNRANILIFWKE